MDEIKLRNLKLAEIFSKQKKEKETWILTENEMKNNIIEIGNDMLIKSKELQQALDQSRLKDQLLCESNTQLRLFEKEVNKRDELISLKKQELNDKQTDINCLNCLVIKLNEDIDKLKSKQRSNLKETNELKMLLKTDEERSKEELKSYFNQQQNERLQLNVELQALKEENKKIKVLDGQISCLLMEKEEILLTHKKVKEDLEEELNKEKLKLSNIIERGQLNDILATDLHEKEEIIFKP